MKMKHKLSEIVKGNKAELQYIKEGKAFYLIRMRDRSKTIPFTYNYLFYIDMTNLDDVGQGKFEIEHNAIELMRWIRKSIESEEIVGYDDLFLPI